jgi:hypothetical protein
VFSTAFSHLALVTVEEVVVASESAFEIGSEDPS